MNKEKEYGFNFRGQCMGVEAESLESAYGYFYSPSGEKRAIGDDALGSGASSMGYSCTKGVGGMSKDE